MKSRNQGRRGKAKRVNENYEKHEKTKELWKIKESQIKLNETQGVPGNFDESQ